LIWLKILMINLG